MQATERLVAAGVERSFLERQKVHAVLDTENVAHQPDCEWAPTGSELISAAAIFDAIPCPDCEVLQEIVDADPRMGMLSEILVARQMAEDTSLPSDAVIVRSLLHALDSECSEIEMMLPVSGEIDPAAESALEALGLRRRGLVEHLRTLQEGVLERCRAESPGREDGPLMAVGILGWVERVSTSKLVDAIVAVYSHETADQAAVVLVAPEIVHEALSRSRLARRAGELTEPFEVPADADPVALAEVLAGIWAPSTTGALSSLRTAVETSNSLLGAGMA